MNSLNTIRGYLFCAVKSFFADRLSVRLQSINSTINFLLCTVLFIWGIAIDFPVTVDSLSGDQGASALFERADHENWLSGLYCAGSFLQFEFA